MAATAAAAVASSFTTSMQSLNCIRSKTFLSSDHLLRIASTRMLQVTSIPHALGSESSSNPCVVLAGKWRLPRMAAAVAQEEAAMTAPVEEEEKEVENVAEKEESGGDGAATESSPVNTKLYFGNLPYHCDSAQLAAIVQDYGSPELIEVLYNRETGKSRGFAFVTMSSIEDCHAVIENLDGREFGGRTLRVNFSDKPRPKEPLYPETEYKLFVGNLSWSVTSEILTEAFQQSGNVVGARVLYDGETGRSRGYGFVCYGTKDDMENALRTLNGLELEGRNIRISLAQGKRN